MNPNQPQPNSGSPGAQPPAAGKPEQQIDYRRQALAVSMELAKNAVRARTLEELQFILVNDTRAILPFDRSLLFLHFDGKSSFSATNNQPQLEKKSDFVKRADNLAPYLKTVTSALILFAHDFKPGDLSEEIASQLKAYMDYSKSSCMVLIPFSVYDNVIGHLLLEFFGEQVPGEVETLSLMNMVPFFSSALSEKWNLDNNKAVRKSVFKALEGRSGRQETTSRAIKWIVGLIVVALVVFGLSIPVDLRVGGQSLVAPEHEYYAFVEIEGIIKEVFVKSGQYVKKGELLATLDDEEIEFKIREAKRNRQSYRKEIEILRNMGAEDPAKLAESQLIAIKHRRAQQQLDFLTWQKQYLTIEAPEDGIILTEQIDAVIGKRFKAGEPLCTIAPSRLLLVDIFVKESDVGFVKVGQSAEIFFNFQPNQGYQLTVKSIAPSAEAKERFGNVFTVKATFQTKPPDLKPGMQGIAQITTQKAGLWFVLSRRMRTKINEFRLYF
jgi:multidrug efflux pump subunit AcrA (membrane-fusion protein)